MLATWTCETCHRYSFADLVFAHGWLVDLRAVEPTVAALDRIHYIPTYESSQVETLLGRSMWDEQGIDGGAGDQERRTTVGYVERVPPGWPLPLTKIPTEPNAFLLGAQVAEKLLAAAADGVFDVGLRPEYVWVVNRPTGPEVTGLGGRNDDIFTAAYRRRDLRTAPLYTRRYLAPEVNRGERYDARALVLTLAVMAAEWRLGRYPYEEGDGAYGYNRLCRGEHVQLPSAARDLTPALSPDPAGPTLADFARTLHVLARTRRHDA